jgi:predicted nuclease with RNAse H fold
MAWFGADPGGANAFGVALLGPDGSFESAVVSCADGAFKWLEERTDSVDAAGIDAPLWWSSEAGGDRCADRILRKTRARPIQPANCLRGAALVQGVMLAIRLRERSLTREITEVHPKALLRAMSLSEGDDDAQWMKIAEKFGLIGEKPQEQKDHKRDALLAAVAAREGSAGQWRHDLALCKRLGGEQDPTAVPWGPVHYWWPEVPAKCE